MKKRITTILLVTVLSIIWAERTVAQCVLGGNHIMHDTEWSPSSCPEGYSLIDVVYIDPGVTLTIQAGTVVHIVSGYLFVQGGNIQALGTSTAPIVFDAPNGNHPDCINVNPIGNTESVFRWCLFSNFTYALENFRKPIEITNCSFINCVRGVDIQCNGPDQEAVTITNCDFIWDDYFDGWGNAWTGIMLKRADHFGNSYLVANCRFMKTGEWPEWDHIVGLICTSIGDAVANHSHEYCTVANNHFDNTLSQGHFGMSFWAPGGWSEAPQIVNNYIGGGESVHWNDVPPPERQFARNNLVITPFGTDDIDCSGMTVFYGETQHLYIDPDRENPFLV